MSIGIPVAADSRNNIVPWGQALPTKVEQTLPLYPQNMIAKDGVWQIVNGTRFKFFVYSAFYDRRDGKMVRIIGATKTRSPEKVWCRLWYPYTSGNTTKYWSVTIMARVKIIRENWNLKYSACFILCPLKGPASEVPHSISIVSRLRTPPGNVLLLRNSDTDPDLNVTGVNNIPEKLAVCVKPLHFNYDQALHLMEFIELNSILGVSHFTLYNHTIGPRAACVLRHYMEGSSRNSSNETNYIKPKATVTLLPWDLRMRSQKEIRTEGLFAALNDCLYRSMYR